MKTKIEIKSVLGKLLFTYESENATVKKAVEEAVKNWADLSMADLSEANLSGADLSGADLSMADLSLANLSGVDLSGVVKTPIWCKWDFGITDGMIHVGCEKRSVEDWKKFLESDEVIETDRNSDEFKQIVKVIKALIAYQEA